MTIKSNIQSCGVGRIILLSAALRCLGLLRPLLGNFSGYQVDLAMVARHFVEQGFGSLLYPQVNILSAGKPGLLLLSYPIASFIAALFSSVTGVGIEIWGRFQAVIFFGLAALFLYRLVLTLSDRKIALGGLIVFCLSPLTIIYGQSFQNEMATVFFSVFFLYQWLLWIQKGSLLSGVWAALSWSGVLLTRPNNVYLLLPMLYLTSLPASPAGGRGAPLRIRNNGSAILKCFFVLVVGSLLPVLWYGHIWRVTLEAPNLYSTLFAQLVVRGSFVSPIILSLEYYRALFDLLAGVTFTPFGLTFLVMGLFLFPFERREMIFFLLWGLSFLASSFLIPRKLIDHNFYLLHLLVPAAPIIAMGFLRLIENLPYRQIKKKGWWMGLFAAVLFFASFRYALHPAFVTPAEERHVPALAQTFQSLTEKSDTKVIVQDSKAFLYYTDRYGWAMSLSTNYEIQYYRFAEWEKLPPDQQEAWHSALKDTVSYVEYLRTYQGATHFVVTNLQNFERFPQFKDHLIAHYPVLYEEKGKGIIFNLRGKL